MAKKAKPRTSRSSRNKKIYISDDLSDFVWVNWIDGRQRIEVSAELTKLFIQRSLRGVPSRCLGARGILQAAEANPSLFPHAVQFAYMEKNSVFILPRTRVDRPGEMLPAIRYAHDFDHQDDWDKAKTKKQFLEEYGGETITIHLSPPVRYVGGGGGSSGGGGGGGGGGKKKKPLSGAKRRAVAAGLVSLKTLAERAAR
jgi:hypothetical protein